MNSGVAAASGPGSVRVAEVVALVERHYPPRTAESWDKVGLVCGAAEWPVSAVLFAVDITAEVVAEAIERGVGLIIAHHPLLLRGIHGIDAAHPKGRLLMDLITHRIACYAAHTNADIAPDGVCVALAEALGLTSLIPLDPRPVGHRDQNVSLVPAADTGRGIGRIGVLPDPLSAAAFAQQVADVLPATVTGVRLAGDPDREVSRVAVLAGAGDSHLDAARAAGVDAYVTSDLRHHPATEARAWAEAPVLIDIAHWAAEWPWLPVLSDLVAAAFPGVAGHVSTLNTDAWTERFARGPR